MGPGDEHPHPPAGNFGWAEWWHFDFSSIGGLNGHVRLCLLPGQGVAHYWANLMGPDLLPVVVYDDEVPLPREGSLEIRTEGLWADHVVEAPLEQVGVGCEAFGLRLGSLADLDRTPVVGERIPFGLDLEWATAPGAELDVVADPGSASVSGYRIDCQVYGEVLVADERITLDAPGGRSHGWGTHPPPFLPDLTATQNRRDPHPEPVVSETGRQGWLL